jgi:predicted membrane channel-forming protein YqfA (hemolysin III family)
MKKNTKTAIIFFVLGLAVMFVADMIFHFNNSVETQLKREMNKAEKKIENIFK